MRLNGGWLFEQTDDGVADVTQPRFTSKLAVWHEQTASDMVVC